MEKQRNSAIATASLILGILSFPLGLIGSIPAIICGHIATSRIRKNPDEYTGEGKALAGLILGYLNTVLAGIVTVGIVAAIAIPLMVANTDKAMESEAIAGIGSISVAARLYYVEQGHTPSDIRDLFSAGFLTADDLDGTYYTSNSGWNSVVFDPTSGRVQAATLTDINGNSKHFILNSTTGSYEIQQRGF